MELLYIGTKAGRQIVYDSMKKLLLDPDRDLGCCIGNIADLHLDSAPRVIAVELPLVDGITEACIRNLAGNTGAALLGIIGSDATAVAAPLAALSPDALGFATQPAQLGQIIRLLLDNQHLREQVLKGQIESVEQPVHQIPTEPFTYQLNEYGCICDADEAAARATGRTEAFGRSFVQLMHPGDIPKFSAALKRLRKTAADKVSSSFRFRHLYGHYLWVDAEIAPVSGGVAELMITLRCSGTFGMEESQPDLLRMNRLYAMVSNLRQHLASVDSETNLFRELCRTAVLDGSFRVAFISLLDEQNELRLAAQCGLNPADIHLIESQVVADNASLKKVLDTRGNVICNDIHTELTQEFWKPIASRNGLHSFIILPLRKSEGLAGMMILAAPVSGFFQDQEIFLLSEAAADISLKLDVFEKDRLRVAAETRLRDSERSLREAQQIAHLGTWELDFRTNTAVWSEECLRIYGLDPLATTPSYDVWIAHIHPDDIPYVMERSAEAAKTHTPILLDHRIVRGDGTIRHLHSEAHYKFDQSGTPVGLRGIALDITDLKEKELRIQESEQRYSTLFYNCPQPKWLYDIETYRFVHVNRAAVEKYGYSEAEFHQMTIFDIRPAEDKLRVIEFSQKVDSGILNPRERKFRHRTKSGELLDVEIFSNTVTLDNKLYRLVMAVDVTAVNMYEDRMTSAVIQAQENERYEIGAELHDNVCQILAASLMRLAILKNGSSTNFVEDCERVIAKVRRAIKEVRGLSHRLAPTSFDESTLADSLNSLVQTYNSDKLQVDLWYSPALDEEELTQELKLNIYRILQEQLGNIVKHASATEALIRLEKSDSNLRLMISDNGSGFDIQAHKNGIGLANMRRRVDLFRGVFDILTAPGRGCQVTVVIPLVHPNFGRRIAAPEPGSQAV